MQVQGAVPHLAPWRALALFLVVGVLWFAGGDFIMPYWVHSHATFVLLQQLQDYVFVAAAALYAAWLVHGTMRAENQRAHARHALSESEQQLRLALQGSGSGMWDWDLLHGRRTYSTGFEELLRYSGTDFAADFGLRARLHPEDRRGVWQALEHTLRTGTPLVVTARLRCFDGHYRWLEARGMRHTDRHGRVARFSGILSDKQQQQEEQEQLRLAATVAKNTAEGIVVTDAQSKIVWVNPAFSQVMGYSQQELVGLRPSVFKSGRHGPDFYADMWAQLQSTGHWRGEVWNKRKDGEVFPERMSLSAVRDGQGATRHYVCMFTDISTEKLREQQLQEMAHRDALTGLPNHACLVQALDQHVAQAHRSGEKMAVILLNLERFKDVNDSYGLAVGDEVLKHIARQVQAALRTDDVIGRMTGDEFVVLARQLSHDQEAAQIAERLIAAAAQPWKSPDGFAVVVKVRAGICSYPNHKHSAATLLQGAHAAAHAAKQGKGDSHFWCFYSDDLTAAAHERIALEARLRHAVANGHLQLYYQPQVELASGRIVGCEALVRWMDPVEGMISPARFIPVAESSGLIGPLGEWVLNEACRQAVLWQQQGLPPLTVAVNVSLHQFVLTDIVASTQQALARSGLAAKYLELEITESALAQRPDQALATLRRLKELGLRLAIDDFGTGYSSLAHLKRFPIDLLKIDQGFTRDIPNSADDMAISRAVIAMGRNMGMQVLAEGVETQAQLQFLRDHDCGLYQGYWCSRPLPAAQFADFVHTAQAALSAQQTPVCVDVAAVLH